MNQIFLLVLAAVLFAQPALGAVQDFAKKTQLALTAETNDFALVLSSSENLSSRFIRYRPNTQSLSGVQATIGGFTVAYKSAAASTPDQETKKGKTSYEDIRGAINFGAKDQWLLVGYYNRYGGLYIENTSEIDPTYTASSPYIQRSDLGIFNTGVAVLYVFSPEKFSLVAAVMQSARQTESAGSWVAMAGFDGTLIEAENPLVPTAQQSEFGKDAALTSGRFTTASLSGGYGYTLTKAGFFLTGLILLGPGYQWRRYSVAGTEFTSTVNASKSTMGASAGYNGDSFFTGVSFVVNQTDYATESIRIRTSLTSFRGFIGIRF